MRISLHFKLLLIALLMLPIPLIGFRFGAMLKSSLLTSHQETLMLSARAVAATLNNRPELFERELFQSLDQSRDLYLFELSHPIHLNGEVNDWLPELRQAKTFGSKDILKSSLPYGKQTISFKHLVGQRGDFLYALFMVKDDRIVYRKSNSLYLDRSDHLQIGVVDDKRQFCRYIVATDKPGWVNGYLLVKGDEMYFPAKNEPRIQGMWKKTGDGYNLEIRIPLS
ncbi:MAG: histidine kinase, partial [Desulfobulbaceae bacterium]|nr:histidine kinase [Desulfobulbaceae bacterium]